MSSLPIIFSRLVTACLHVARHRRELAHDAVDANPDEHVLASWLEVDVGCALLERRRKQ